jgi:hypothetical protein
MDSEIMLKKIEDSLYEINLFLWDIAESLRVLSKRPDFARDAPEVYVEDREEGRLNRKM